MESMAATRGRVFLAALAVAAATHATAGGHDGSQAGGLLLSTSVASPLTVNEPVVAVVSIANTSQEDVRLELGLDHIDGLRVVLNTPGGTTNPLRTRRWANLADFMGAPGTLLLPAGRIHTQRLLLNEWYDFAEPGHYEVSIRLVETGSVGSVGSVETSTAVRLTQARPTAFEIEPRDEETLRRRCRELAATILNASKFEAIHEAARALSLVADSAAVPYIRNVLKETDKVDWILLPGLLRNGSADARAVLVTASQSTNDERAAIARDNLRRFVSKRP
jgi:hypothetical protein